MNYENDKTDAVDWDLLRSRSLQPFGFGHERRYLWPKLLNVDHSTTNSTSSDSKAEEQTLNDKDPDNDPRKREDLQSQLHKLIVTVFRRRQHLNYFQGYHDIVSVFFLTLPPEIRVNSVEQMSLHRLRDSMGVSLEPVVGLLRILKGLLQATDPEFSALLERHPIAIVYLVAAVVLFRRDQAFQLEKEGEEGMVHSILSSLPDLYEEQEEANPLKADENETKEEKLSITSLKLEPSPLPEQQGGELVEDVSVDFAQNTNTLIEPSTVSTVSTDCQPLESPSTLESSSSSHEAQSIEDPLSDDDASTAAATYATSPPSACADVEGDIAPEELDEAHVSEKVPLSRSSSPELTPPRPRVSLTSLLIRADELFARFPPAHPSITLSSVMGPQSVMLTWSQDPAELPPDDDAELMVKKPELVVRPYIEPDDEVASDDESAAHARHPRAKEQRRRRKLRKPRKLALERKTMVAGAVLVLGVAMAVYGIQNVQGPAGWLREGYQPRNSVGREWKRVSHFLGGVILGAGERVLEGLWH
ncbi:predicted protein [Postia placenta Mad-698-R]|nr:predicted protein [Postia placenta Mad-698-R]